MREALTSGLAARKAPILMMDRQYNHIPAERASPKGAVSNASVSQNNAFGRVLGS